MEADDWLRYVARLPPLPPNLALSLSSLTDSIVRIYVRAAATIEVSSVAWHADRCVKGCWTGWRRNTLCTHGHRGHSGGECTARDAQPYTRGIPRSSCLLQNPRV